MQEGLKKIGGKTAFLGEKKFQNLLLRAEVNITKSGKGKVLNRIMEDIGSGKVRWIPEGKVIQTVVYAAIKLSGLEVDKPLIKKMDLEKEAPSLDKLVEMYEN